MSKNQVQNQNKPVTPGPKGMFSNNVQNQKEEFSEYNKNAISRHSKLNKKNRTESNMDIDESTEVNEKQDPINFYGRAISD